MTPDRRMYGLYTDLYEIRMVESYLARGMTADATFSLYIRPAHQRPWFVALGVDRVVDFVRSFGYGDDEIEYLRSIDVRDATLSWLRATSFEGEIVAVDDGTVVLADEPILEITAPLPIAQLVETAVINLVQYSTLIATKAARVALAAAGRGVVDFGFRRAHGLETGIEAARAACIGGGLSTSNLEAGRRYGIPVVGTMAHAFVQSYADELDAFRAFAEDHPDNCVLLVDTYDTQQGVRKAIVVGQELRAGGHVLRGVRLDSGDLATLSRAARDMLDEAGLHDTVVFASGGLDEHDIATLVEQGAPIGAFGVGTDLVVSADRPSLDIAYKLVSYDGRDVAKHSEGKESLPGAKQVFRSGGPSTDVLALRHESCEGRPLLTPAWSNGSATRDDDLQAMRARVTAELDALPNRWRSARAMDDPPGPRLSEGLRRLTGGS